MKIDFTQVVLDIEGKKIITAAEVRERRDGEGNLITPGTPEKYADLKFFAITALLNESEQIGGDEKFNRGMLAQRIYKEPEACEIKAEELAKIKSLIGNFPAWNAGVVTPVWLLLEK